MISKKTMPDSDHSLPLPPVPDALRLRIDRSALGDNWRLLNDLSGAATAGAAVKADAYGVGAEVAVQALRDAGTQQFFVAHWREVPPLLQHIPASSIAVLHGPANSQEAEFARAIGARPVINSLHQARLWHAAGGGACALMIDTGMNRLGLEPALVTDPDIAALRPDLVFSHLASADEDVAQTPAQLALFRAASAEFPEARRSLANSAGIALGGDYAFDLTRPGLALYGGTPRAELAGRIRQVAFPQVEVLQIRRLAAGDMVGYNATYAAPHALTTATIALGYADGFLRSRGPGGSLLCNGIALPIIGRVSMDMVVVDCSAADDLREGDWLDVPFDLPKASAASGLTQYELLTTLGRRFTRC